MIERLSPQRWAYRLTIILDRLYGDGGERFPIDVAKLAKGYTEKCYPDDPIINVVGDNLPGLEGVLCRVPKGKRGWGIIYNRSIKSQGRINFTLAHEFGHYLIHRKDHPNGFQCSPEDMFRMDSEYRKLEQEANVFAATLLMPLNDFRKQISPKAKPSLSEIGKCANRYNVSLTAAVLRWLEYTERRSVLVVSRDGYILWSWSSESAFKSRLYIKTRDRDPVPIPDASLQNLLKNPMGAETSISHNAYIWLSEPCKEFSISSDQHDFTISLLHFDSLISNWKIDNEVEEDAFERMTRRNPGESWLV